MQCGGESRLAERETNVGEKEFKKLNKEELIGLVHRYQLREQEFEAEIARLKVQLESRRLEIENAGSIAEAALAVNHVFADAQKAADQYLAEIQALRLRTEAETASLRERAQEEAGKILLDANTQAQRLRQETEASCQAIKEQAARDANAQWAAFQQKAETAIAARAELRELLGRKSL